MKTVRDIFFEIGIPCNECKHLHYTLCEFTRLCATRVHMFELARYMVLRGEY